MLDSIPAQTPFRTKGGGLVYNEPAFHHFLGIELARAAHKGRSVALVLVSIGVSRGRASIPTAATASALFASVSAAVREVDLLGWYREGKVAAAVMAHLSESPADLQRRVTLRLAETLLDPLFADTSCRVRVVRLSPERGR